MGLNRLDHVNIHTTRVDELVDWYESVLGMKSGPRPDFPFPGAWLYVGEHAVVHLVGKTAQPQNIEPRIEHFSFSATGMKEQLERLEKHGVAHTIDPVPGIPVVQINLRDPDGNHIHVDYHTDEMG